MKTRILAPLFVLITSTAFAQALPPAAPQVATDITGVEIQAFIDSLPRDRVSDSPIRVVETKGDMRLGIFGVYRPDGVTGDTLVEPYEVNESWLRAKSIVGGVSRRVVPGDVIVIPGHTAHWWSELEGEIEYLIFRPDPDKRLDLQ